MGKDLESPFLEWAKKHYSAEGELRGALRSCRKNLNTLLEKRFGSLPNTIRGQIEACNDLPRLEASLSQVFDINALAEFDL